MKKTFINAYCAALLLTYPARAADPVPAPKNETAKAAFWDNLPQRAIITGEIAVYTPVTGITTAQETYDIFASFDGRVEEVQAEVFTFVTPLTTLARMASTVSGA